MSSCSSTIQRLHTIQDCQTSLPRHGCEGGEKKRTQTGHKKTKRNFVFRSGSGTKVEREKKRTRKNETKFRFQKPASKVTKFLETIEAFSTKVVTDARTISSTASKVTKFLETIEALAQRLSPMPGPPQAPRQWSRSGIPPQ